MSKICCFTGSRAVNSKDIFDLAKRTESAVENLIVNEDYTDFRTGGAVGFDTLAALTVLKLKDKYPHIKLHLILPCKNQEKFFSKYERGLYKYILDRADTFTFLQERYSDGIMFKRNRALVDGADICIAYLIKLYGGTFQTVQYAKKQRVPIQNVAKK